MSKRIPAIGNGLSQSIHLWTVTKFDRTLAQTKREIERVASEFSQLAPPVP